ncbi:MAG: DAK2 domain-containing protein, partial [Synergistaceae bacterium]|nr:DAK2 domain-containing protein [Synergistaceae bacterium]
LGSAASEIEKLGGAVRGDKTLLDSLLPAVEAFDASFEETGDFAEALTALQAAAEEGRESTRDMVARVGRASRLGERSRGVLDAGATSCCLLLNSMAESVKKLLKEV